jgi:hypothetical protein
MENKNYLLKPFSIWAKETKDLNPDIINRWLNGTDPCKRAEARMILEAASEI